MILTAKDIYIPQLLRSKRNRRHLMLIKREIKKWDQEFLFQLAKE